MTYDDILQGVANFEAALADPAQAMRAMRLELIPALRGLVALTAQNSIDIVRTYTLAERTASYDAIESAVDMVGEAIESLGKGDTRGAREMLAALQAELSEFLTLDSDDDSE